MNEYLGEILDRSIKPDLALLEISIQRVTKMGGLLKYLQHIEKNIIYDALVLADFNCTNAAKILGMGRPLLVYKRKQYGFPLGKATKRNGVKNSVPII